MSDDIAATADRLAIIDVLCRYCRAMDRVDHEQGYAIWHENGLVDYGPIFRGSGREFIDWVCEVHLSMLSHVHQLSNIIIELRGDRAASESYVSVTLRYKRDGRLMELTSRGRYLDRWSRRAGRWGIDKRSFVQDFDEEREVAAIRTEGWGRRDQKDPSYEVLSVNS